MEKRGLIAMGLIFLLLLVYQVFFTPQRQPQQVPVEQVAPAPAETVRADSVAVGLPELDLNSQELPEKEIVVETPLYSARLSSRGGVLTSFQLKRYPTAGGTPVEMVADAERRPLATALLTRSGERVDLSETIFTVSAESLVVGEGVDEALVFELTTAAGLDVTKTLTFSGGAYTIGLELAVAGPGAEAVRAVETGWQSGLPTSEANRSDDLRNFAAVTLTDQGLVKNSLGKVKKGEQISAGGAVAWSGLRSKYFFAGFVPLSGTPVVARAFLGAPEAIGLALEAELDPAKPLEFMVYAGPLDYIDLKKLGHGLEKSVDFGWKWISPLSKLIYIFLVNLYKVIPNYGWVIIILSALIKLLFHPLTAKSMKSMRDMQRLQPEIQALREKHKKEPQKLNAAMLELYKKRGINPVGGCLPLLLQMPVFFALFNVLSKTIELRRAGFIFWIKDLSAPDVIARVPFALPFIGSSVSLLPILMGIAMFLQQKMTPSDPKQAMMTYLLPIVFTVMFYKFPSGLVLYWLVNNVLTIIHQHLMNRADRVHQAEAAA
jgi:YidC/Oxa1 family membrane protein insertase